MIDIVANLKIDESKSERVDHFLACIKSLEYLTPDTGAKFIFNLEGKKFDDSLYQRTFSLFEQMGVDCELDAMSLGDYGTTYIELLKRGTNPYVMNFIEDHFSVIDDSKILNGILESMNYQSVDICKATFFEVEKKSSRTLRLTDYDTYGKYFLNNARNHSNYQQHYGKRYYIGVNFITTRSFAVKFWNRKLGKRPHEYEIVDYDDRWLHNCMIPNIEILASIDDNHGEDGTRLLDRKDQRFWRIYNSIIGVNTGSGA